MCEEAQTVLYAALTNNLALLGTCYLGSSEYVGVHHH